MGGRWCWDDRGRGHGGARAARGGVPRVRGGPLVQPVPDRVPRGGRLQLAQDLLQESLVKTYVAWPRLRDVGSAEPNARRVIVTTSISWRRRRSFHERPVEAMPEVVVADTADVVAGQTDLWTQIHALPPRQRAAVVLRSCEDLSEARTSELMGCSVGSVKRHASHGLAKLRGRMGAQLSLPSSDESAVTS